MRESHSRLKRAAVLAAASIVMLVAAHSTAARAQEDILNYKGADRDQKLIDGAKREGIVNFYSAVIVNQALRPIADAFQKKYPFIKLSYWRADTEDIIAKLQAEERANNLVGDVIEGTGVGELAVADNLLTPYYTPLIEKYPASERDPDNLWTPTRLSYFGTAYNTKLVPPGTQPKSYEDLLDPKWQGKLSWRINTSTGTPLFITNLRMAWGDDKAMAYFQKLKNQKVINFGSGSARTLVDRTMAGEYPIALNIFAHHPLISKAKGAPVDSQMMDPVATTAATMGIPKGVRHPYAAMLLIDFILSDEGQHIMSGAQYFPSLPDVPPQPELEPVIPKNAGVTENFISPENLLKYNDSSEKIYEDLFR